MQTVRLDEVCDLNPRWPRDHALGDDTPVSFVPMASICELSGTIRERQERPFAEVRRGYTCFAEGDVLFAKITPCMQNGKAAIARNLTGGVGFGSTEFHVLRAREDRVLPEWLFYFVRRERFRHEARRSLTGTAGQQRVPTPYMAATRIPLPPLQTQRSMTGALSCADRLIQLSREARQKTDLFLAALLVDLFGSPRTNPSGWPEVPLGDILGAIESGTSPRCHDRARKPGEWGVLRLSALKNSTYDESDHKTLPDQMEPDPRCEVRQDDLLLVRKNTLELVGTPAYVWKTEGRMMFPDLVFRLCIKPEAGVEPLFLRSLLAHPTMRDRMRLMASGTAGSMPNISKERLRTVRAMVPPLAMQQRFAWHARELHRISLGQDSALARAKGTMAALLYKFFEPA